MNDNITTTEIVEEGKLKKNMGTLIILIISGAMIYALPYFKAYYYDAFVLHFNLTNTQMGTLGSVYGLFAIPGYIMGGFMADRFSTRKLMTFSLMVTGILALVLLFYPPYPVVLLIHAVWGITTIMTFWNALVKAIRTIASSNEQGRAFGLFEGGRGIVNIVQATAMLALFSYLSKVASDKVGLSAIIAGYAAIHILLGVLLWIRFKDPFESKNVKGQSFINVPVLKKALKMPTTWLVVAIIFTSYTVIISYFYFTPYTTQVFGATATLGAFFSIFSQYMRPIGSFTAGFAADKFGSSKILLICFIILTLSILGITITPGKASLIWIVVICAVSLYTVMYGIQSLHYAILEEGDYSLEMTGTVTSIVCPLGYSAEFFAPLVAGPLLDKFPGVTGYKYFFTYLTAMGVIGIIVTLIWLSITKERRMELANARKK